MLLHETFRIGVVFLSQSKWVQIVVCYDQNLQKHKYLSGISMLLHETFRTGLIFLSRSKWVQTVVCYNWNLQKHKYLSRISTLLHKTFRTGLVFLSQLKWVQIVVYYKRNLWKCKYLSEIPFWANLTHFFGRIWHCGSFLASLVWKESKKLKNSKNYGEKPAKWPKLAVLSQSNWLFQQNLPLWVTFSQFGVKGIQKVCQCTPPKMEIFEISDEMRCFGGKRWEKLWIA